jgi:hypothetical protein
LAAKALAESHRQVAEQQRAEANAQRLRAESKAAEADRERANAERRLGELQKLAGGMVRIYRATGSSAQESSQLVAENVHDSLLALGKERQLEPGLRDVLDRTTATLQSRELAHDPAWQVPAGWTARETGSHEYRVGVDQRIVHGGKRSLFLTSLVAHPSGAIAVFQGFDAVRYRGQRVRLTAFLRSETVASRGHLGLSMSGNNLRVEVSGTSSWKRYELVADVPRAARSIEILVVLEGTGTLWADDFTFEQVNNSVPLTPKAPDNLSFTK